MLSMWGYAVWRVLDHVVCRVIELIKGAARPDTVCIPSYLHFLLLLPLFVTATTASATTTATSTCYRMQLARLDLTVPICLMLMELSFDKNFVSWTLARV